MGSAAKCVMPRQGSWKGTPLTVDQVLEEVLKDAAFDANSGGGMTLSGGEPLAQAAFAAAILQAAKAKGVHTAVETAGHVPWGSFEQNPPLLHRPFSCTTWKHMDPEVHRQWIGQTPTAPPSLVQFGAADRRTRNIILRTPGYPRLQMITKLTLPPLPAKVGFLALMNLHLLPFHRFGEGEYRLLDREPPFQSSAKSDT